MILVDTNVLIDIATNDPSWAQWSLNRLDDALLVGRAVINAIVYAELSSRYSSMNALDDFLQRAAIEIAEIPKEALFLSGHAFVRYRRAGGRKSGVSPDFFIGAHAAVMDIPLLTRDPRRYRHYFPTIQLVSPVFN